MNLFAKLKLSIAILLEEVKLVVTENIEFVDWQKSVLIGILECSDYQDFDAKIKINDFVVEYPSECVKFSIETSMIEMIAVVTEKIEFEYMDKSILLALFWIFRPIRILMQGSK